MRELRTSGSAGAGAGNRLGYPAASHLGIRFELRAGRPAYLRIGGISYRTFSRCPWPGRPGIEQGIERQIEARHQVAAVQPLRRRHRLEGPCLGLLSDAL